MLNGYASDSGKISALNLAKRAVWAACTAVFAYAAWWSVEVAVADSLFRQNTVESLRKSIALAPGNASFRALLAEHIEGTGFDPDQQLAAAAALSPLDSQFWTGLGFRAEAEGDYPRAEQYLWRGAAVDRKFGPRWALMNYYFRRRKADEFWYWTRRAADMSYGDLTPLFRLAWDMGLDDGVIRSHLPERKDILTKYLAFLVENHLESAGPAAHRLALVADEADTDPLLDYCDKVLDKDPSAALAVWNVLCVRRLLPFTALDRVKGPVVTNGDFSVGSGTSPRRGFDWRLPAADGISVLPAEGGRDLSIHLTGDEPEDCLLLFQALPTTAGTRYRISYQYRLLGEGPIAGLNWIAGNTESPELAAGGEWKTGELRFEAGAGGSVRLALHYRRPNGAVRAEGTVVIRGVKGEIAE